MLSFYFFFVILCTWLAQSSSNPKLVFLTEDEAEQWIVHQPSRIDVLQSGIVEQSLTKAWWNLTEKLIKIAYDEDIDISSKVQTGISSLHRRTAEISRYLEGYRPASLAVQELPPAFQWAESATHIYLQIKLAYRWTSPGALSVENEKMSLTSTRLMFSGVGTTSNIKKRYILHIELYSAICPDESEWNWGSVGKLIVALKKTEKGYWHRLTKGTEKIPNMHAWLEMKERISQQEDNKTSTPLPNDTTTQIPNDAKREDL